MKHNLSQQFSKATITEKSSIRGRRGMPWYGKTQLCLIKHVLSISIFWTHSVWCHRWKVRANWFLRKYPANKETTNVKGRWDCFVPIRSWRDLSTSYPHQHGQFEWELVWPTRTYTNPANRSWRSPSSPLSLAPPTLSRFFAVYPKICKHTRRFFSVWFSTYSSSFLGFQVSGDLAGSAESSDPLSLGLLVSPAFATGLATTGPPYDFSRRWNPPGEQRIARSLWWGLIIFAWCTDLSLDHIIGTQIWKLVSSFPVGRSSILFTYQWNADGEPDSRWCPCFDNAIGL